MVADRWVEGGTRQYYSKLRLLRHFLNLFILFLRKDFTRTKKHKRK